MAVVLNEILNIQIDIKHLFKTSAVIKKGIVSNDKQFSEKYDVVEDLNAFQDKLKANKVSS